jgi:hypothetical protein
MTAVSKQLGLKCIVIRYNSKRDRWAFDLLSFIHFSEKNERLKNKRIKKSSTLTG